jgi:hypothetical protein
VRDAGVIHQNVNPFVAEQLVQNDFYLRLIGHITNEDRGVTTVSPNLLTRSRRAFLVYVQNPNARAICGKLQRHGLANSTSRARDHGDSAVEPEFGS